MTTPSTAPALSTAQDESEFAAVKAVTGRRTANEDIGRVYEVDRTVEWIVSNGSKRVGLQFPDGMLADAVEVVSQLERAIKAAKRAAGDGSDDDAPVRLFILGDTSYGSCCVDEVAAEHGSADAVVHYGRACLSPTARLPVLWIYTTRPVDLDQLVDRVVAVVSESGRSEAVLVADLPYQAHLSELVDRVRARCGVSVWVTDVVHDPAAPIPNRTLVEIAGQDDTAADQAGLLARSVVVHLGTPPTALLLTLSSRTGDLVVVDPDLSETGTSMTQSTSKLLMRRYGTVTSVSTAGVWGILVNTLSVRDYGVMIDHVRAQIAAAAKKSYTIVVGKINPAKVANFAEIEAWVVVGCWESSLVDVAGQSDFWRPLVTPFELALALQPDHHRVWTGEWKSDLATVLAGGIGGGGRDSDQDGDGDDGNESDEPPEFDLRTGRYIASTNSRPMMLTDHTGSTPLTKSGCQSCECQSEQALVPTGSSETQVTAGTGTTTALASYSVAGVFSPGARFLHTKREWRGLGTDHDDDSDNGGDKVGAPLEQGIGGIARGYAKLSVDESGRH